MQVRFFAYLRKITGCAEADVPYRETAGALAHSLCDLYGEELRKKIFPSASAMEKPKAASRGRPKKIQAEEKFGPEIIILINGRHVSHLGGTSAPLKSEDRVDIFPVVAGG